MVNAYSKSRIIDQGRSPTRLGSPTRSGSQRSQSINSHLATSKREHLEKYQGRHMQRPFKDPGREPVREPIREPVTESVTEPVTKPVTEPVREPVRGVDEKQMQNQTRV